VTFGETWIILCSLGHRSNAFCTQQLAHPAAIHHNRNPLKIGAEGTVGGPLGEAAIMTEGCGLSTRFTLCHFRVPFPTMIADKMPGHT
jgi:hypothetical protein